MISSSLLSALLWLWRDHKIYPSLSSWKKNVPLLSLVKRMEFERERERGRVVGWFWHIFSVVIMDPSYRMICSSTWLTELSSINKHSTCRNTHSKFPLFSELRLDCGAWLTCSSALCPRKNKKELLAALFAHLTSLSLTSISGTPWVTFGAFGSLTDPHIFRDIKQKGHREDFCCACRVLTCTAEMHSPHLPCLR